MPQAGLQQSQFCGQTFVPHWPPVSALPPSEDAVGLPLGARSGPVLSPLTGLVQSMGAQSPPFATQIPQLALQHTSPWAQVFVPHLIGDEEPVIPSCVLLALLAPPPHP
jgi:hypothetical protein